MSLVFLKHKLLSLRMVEPFALRQSRLVFLKHKVC